LLGCRPFSWCTTLFPANSDVPDAVQTRFMALMAQINRQWRRVIDRQLRPLGLTEAMWLPLLHLSRAPKPIRQKELATSLGLDASSIVRLLDGLESAGLMERSEAVDDRRAKTLQLTPSGVETVRQVEALVAESRASLLAGVPREALDSAWQVMVQLSTALSRAEGDAQGESPAEARE